MALEEALQIPGAEITALSMGPSSSRSALEGLIQRGIPHVILLSDSAFAGADTLATAYVLSQAIGRLKPDLVLCGRQSLDGDTAQTGPGIAAFLGWPCLPYALELSVEEGIVRARTRMGERAEPLPAVVTLERTQVFRLPGIRKKKGLFEVWNASDVGADLSRCGLSGSPTRVLRTWERK